MASTCGAGGLLVRGPSPRPGHFDRPATPNISPRTPKSRTRQALDYFSMETDSQSVTHSSIIWVMHALHDERQAVVQELERRHNALFEKLTGQLTGVAVSKQKQEEPKLVPCWEEHKKEFAPSPEAHKPVHDNPGPSRSPTATSLGKQSRGTFQIAEYLGTKVLKRSGTTLSANSNKTTSSHRSMNRSLSTTSLGKQARGNFQISEYLDAKVLSRSNTSLSATSNKTSSTHKSMPHSESAQSRRASRQPRWNSESSLTRANSFNAKVRSPEWQACNSESSLESVAVCCKSQKLFLQRLVYDPFLELLLGILILLNTCALAVEVQYLSFDVAELVELSNYSGGSEQVWPGVKKTLDIAEIIFGVIFTLEVVSKVIVGPCIFVKSLWNWFDALIVAFWLISSFGNVKNTSFLRILRLGRMFRIFRVGKAIPIFEVLHLLFGSLKASAAVMLGSLVFISSLILCCALLINLSIDGYLRDPHQSVPQRQEVFKWYGSFSRSTISMFEMTIGNWGPPLRVLQENVSEWYGAVLLIYVCTVHFAVVQVVRGVFINETFQVVASDDDMMIMQKERKSKKMIRNLYRLFRAADTDESGTVSKEEFVDIVEDPRVKAWLSAMDFDIYDPLMVFELLDSSRSSELSPDQVVQGVAKLTGPSRSCDLLAMQKQLSVIQRSCRDVCYSLAQVGIGKCPAANDIQRRFSLMASCTEGPYAQSSALT